MANDPIAVCLSPGVGQAHPVAQPVDPLSRLIAAPARPPQRPHRAWAPVLVWVLTRAWMVLFVVHEVSARAGQRWVPVLVSTFVTNDSFNDATKLTAGQAPYRNFVYEYPPANLPFLAAAHWTSHAGDFLHVWIAMMLVLDAATAVILWRWARATRPSVGRGALWLWIAAIPMLGPMVLVRNDLIVASAVVAAIWLAATHRFRRSGALWTFAVLAKLWPIAPLVMFTIARRKGRGRSLTGVLLVAAATAATLAIWGVGGAMISNLFMRHGHRPLEIETTWAVTAALVAAAHGAHLRTEFSYGSLNVVTGFPGWVPALAYQLTYLVELAGISAITILGWRHRTRPSLTTLAWLTLAVVAGSLATAPVLSPQYLLWLIAAACVVLCVERSRATRRLAGAVCAAAALTQLEYPVLFNQLTAGRLNGLLVTEARNVLLVLIAVGAAAAGFVRVAGRDSPSRQRVTR